MASDAQVKATFAGPLLFLASGQWTHVLASLRERLPLRNLHWKPTARPAGSPIRTVQELDVAMLLFDTVRDEPSSQIPVTLLERPLLNIYFFSCEDADTYKASMRKQIKDWHNIVTQRKNQEWLIVLVVRPETQANNNRLFQRASILDKVKSDFNVAKRDRCTQLAWSVGSDDPAAWSDLVSKMKDGVISTFDAHIAQREDEVRRSELQRHMPGWNFCTFFILKESLASSFEGINLIEEAQTQYDELEASFFKVLKEKNLSWFGQLGGTAPHDDSAPLLSITKKPYRDLILSNTITVFDFRSYLLARQCFLLARLGKIGEAASKAARFVTAFARTLQENKHALSEFFVESWMYSSAFNVVDTCEHWAEASRLDSVAVVAFNAVKGELLELARCQLDKIGIQKGHLPSSPPFTLSLPAAFSKLDPTRSHVTPSRQGPPISRLDLLEAIRDRDAFDQLYVATTHRAIQTYGSCGRKKFALKLHASLAALDHCRDRYPSAYSVFSSLPSYYVTQKWTSLEGFTLSQSMECYPRLDRPLDEEWIAQALAFLKALVIGGAAGGGFQRNGEGTMSEEEEEDDDSDDFAGKDRLEQLEYVKELVGKLRDAGEMLDSEYEVRDHPAFSIEVSQPEEGRLLLDEDGSLIDIRIKNILSAVVTMDEITMIFEGKDREKLIFAASQATVLPPGQTNSSLVNPVPSSGLFALKAVRMRLGGVAFLYDSPKASPSSSMRPVSLHEQHNKPSSFLSKQMPPTQVIRLSKDTAAVDVQVGFPRHVVLDASAHVTVTLSTGRNQVVDAVLRFSNLGDQVVFDTQNAKLLDTDVGSVEFTTDAIVVKNVAPKVLLRFNLPYTGLRLEVIRIQVQVDYLSLTSKNPKLRRKIVRTRYVNTALPLAVNVQDYFRGKRLFSRFRISCAGDQALKIRDAVLENRNPSPSLQITRCRRAEAVPETITALRPAYYLFGIESESDSPRQESSSMFLKLTYRTLREDVETRVTHAINHACSESPSLLDHRAWMWQAIMKEIESQYDWVDRYGRTGKIDIRSNPWDKKVASAGLPRGFDETSRTVLAILNAARIDVPSAAKESVFAGQSLRATLSITTSFHWGTNIVSDEHLLRFDVNAEADGSWLVSGPKRGEYLAKDDSTYETRITLVPLRHGSLLLPKVTVVPVLEPAVEDSMGMPSCETHQTHLAQRVNVLPRSARSTYIVELP